MTTFNWTLTDGADDGTVTFDGTSTFSLTTTVASLSGRWNMYRAGGVTIPQGVIIDSATLTVFSSISSGSNTLETYAVAADDVPALTASLATATKTTAHSSTPAPTGAAAIDVTEVLQEIVNRAGWVAGNAVAFTITQGTGNTTLTRFIEGSATYAATLAVEYHEGSPPGVRVAAIEASTEGALPSVRVMELEVFTDAPPPVAGPAKLWTGDQWAEAVPHVWAGDQWVPVQPHVWTGDQWVPTT